MPSLIYITRIRPLPAELAQALASSGSHVKSFGPGEITADECILVMTSEAVLAGLRVPGMPPVSGRPGTQSPQSPATPSLHDVDKPGGAEAAVWNSIKAAELVGSAIGESERPPALVSPIQTIGRADDDSGVVPSQAPPRATPAQKNESADPQVVPTGREPAAKEKDRESDRSPGVPFLPVLSPGKAPSAAIQLATLLSRRTGLSNLIRSANGQRHRRFWPAAMAAVLLILAPVLLVRRGSVLPSRAEVATTGQMPQAADRPATSNIPPNLPEALPRKSGNDFVAEDYTTRFERNGQRRTALQAPDLRPEAQNRPIPKRIVEN